MSTFKTFGFIGAAVFGVMAAENAAAERLTQHERTAIVQAADLDLTRERDVRVLYDRIRYAAHSLCLSEESAFDVRKATRRRRCVQNAIDAAIERTNTPLLTAVHLQQSARMAQL